MVVMLCVLVSGLMSGNEVHSLSYKDLTNTQAVQ